MKEDRTRSRRSPRRTGKIRIGISGWRYPPWRGVFYPKGLAQRAELAHASRCFATIEINGTFYSLQRPERFVEWDAATPDDFIFAVKGSRYVTHMKRLVEVETPLANFFASGVLRLGAKLGPFLWQFPPRFRFDEARLEAFFRLLPQDYAAASELARRHDERVAGRAYLGDDRSRQRLRHAIEIRHDSFRDERFIALLRRHGIALVFADAVEWPYFEDVTADFLYLRLHGSEELYVSGYSDADLDRWAARIRAWAAGGEPADRDCVSQKRPPRKARDVYCYFDNDAKVRAPFDAANLARRLIEG